MRPHRIAILLATTIGLMRAQTGTLVSAKFEVASIRPNPGGSDNGGMFLQPGGRFGARNISLRSPIRTAYGVKDSEIFGGPAWINTDGYDVVAKAPEGDYVNFEPMRPMLQSLLADRFGLRFHHETKDLPVYSLAEAKRGLRLPPPKDGNCTTGAIAPPRPGERRQFFCGNVRAGRGVVEGYRIDMPRLVTALSDALGRPVIDKTGFKKTFDAHLSFAPDEVIGGAAAASDRSELAASDQTGPSIFTALEEQLGLRLESARGPVDVLVIDSVEKPSEN